MQIVVGIGSFGEEACPIADGYLVYLNTYDMQIYCIGKGPSATTVSAPQTVAAKGTGVLITGSVTDISAGAKQLLETGEFTTVAAMSDESMGPWMEYLYMQKPIPENATGVQVKLTAVDANGVSHDVGTATTDNHGNSGISWTPTEEGIYHITAEFEGSNSYFSSDATTYVAVGPSSAVASPTLQPTTPSESSTVPPVSPTASPTPGITTGPGGGESNVAMYVAIAVVVVIVVIIAVAIALRRRK